MDRTPLPLFHQSKKHLEDVLGVFLFDDGVWHRSARAFGLLAELGAELGFVEIGFGFALAVDLFAVYQLARLEGTGLLVHGQYVTNHKLSQVNSFCIGSAGGNLVSIGLARASVSCLESPLGGGLVTSLVEYGLLKSCDKKASLKKSPLKALLLRILSCGSR